ncbi:MAG: hypothetical protein V4583_13485 [Pseudomonadota bacterium]
MAINDKVTNQESLGFSDCMGPRLREFVENQLLIDLKHYMTLGSSISASDVRFDWSESCVEGHRIRWLDGEIENFSGIAVFDRRKRLVAEGWMEFIETNGGLEIFWWFLHGGDDYGVHPKSSNHVPQHIWDRLDDAVRSGWVRFAPNGAQPA